MRILLVGGACQGKNAYARQHYAGTKITADLHLLVREVLRQEGEVGELRARFPADGNWTVVCDDLGSGVIPLDRLDRLWREETGRLCCELAARADIVERITCGIALRLKG